VSSALTADHVTTQIDPTRRYGAKGFIIFNCGGTGAKTLLPMPGLGVMRKP
jgi:hypothetical protein